MIIIFHASVKRSICEGRWTTVECGIDHDERRNNWDQSHRRTEEGAASNRYKGRPKSCTALRDFVKRCRCIVQGRRACISPAAPISPEERALRVGPALPDLGRFPECDAIHGGDMTGAGPINFRING